MKKLIAILLLAIMVMVLASCGGGDDSSSGDSRGGAEAPQIESETPKVEKTLDATAEYLGLEAGEETFYEMIGAEAGKEYNDGLLEIYKFDENSDAYKEAESSKTLAGTDVAACKDGFVIIFVSDEADQNIIDKFNKIEYK